MNRRLRPPVFFVCIFFSSGHYTSKSTTNENLMAAKKVSNRQRMINMMYLVLLALLALNVSVEILPAINNLRIRLQSSALNAQEDGMQAFGSIRQLIINELEKEGKTKNQGLLDTLNQVQTASRDIVMAIDRHISAMDGIAVFDQEKQRYRRMDEMEENFKYWMGDDEEANSGRGNGEAFELHNRLDSFGGLIADLYNTEVRGGATQMKNILVEEPSYGIDASSKKKSWERFTFDGPVIGNMATLEALKIDVLQRQQQLLDLYQERFSNDNQIVADSVVAISSPLSRIITAGLPFRTQLSVGLVSSTILPEFSSGSGNISLENGGNSAWLQVMANGGLIPAGQSEATQNYTAYVEVPMTDGSKKRLAVQESFTVRRPEIQITSAAVQILYRKCSNAVNIEVPALGEYYDPVITATQADIQQSQSSKQRFRIVPEGTTTSVTVKSRTNGQLVEIGKVNYRVVEPPKPGIQAGISKNAYRPGMGIRSGMSIDLGLKADPEFVAAMPEDANYQIGEVEILLKDGLGPARIVKRMNFRGNDANRSFQRIRMPVEVSQARPGSLVYIRIKEVYRKNYRNQLIEDTRIEEIERTLSFVKE